jgi:hypothetical protein
MILAFDALDHATMM